MDPEEEALRIRNTAIAALLLAGLAAWIYFYEYRGEEARAKAEQDGKKVALFNADEADTLAITKGGAEIRLARRDGIWRIEAPIGARADADEVAGLLSTITFLEVTSRLGKPEEGLDSYGLADPAVEVTLGPGAGRPPISFGVGGKTPVGSAYYARIGDSPEVVAISASAGKLLDVTGESLRYRKIVGVDSWAVTRFGIDTHGGTLGFAKQGSDWRIEQPVRFPADRGKVSSLLYDLTSLKADGFDPPGTDPASVGLDEPAATLTVKGEGEPVVVTFGRPDAEGVVRARRNDMEEIFKVGRGVLDKLPSSVEEYRDARVAPVNKWEISEIKAVTPEGEKHLFKDAEANWRWNSLEGPALDASSVDPLLEAIESARATGYIDGAGAQEEIGGAPTLRLEIKAGDGAPIEVRMGREDGGKVLFASSAASTLYEVEKSAADKLVEVARGLQPPVTSASTATGESGR